MVLDEELRPLLKVKLPRTAEIIVKILWMQDQKQISMLSKDTDLALEKKKTFRFKDSFQDPTIN